MFDKFFASEKPDVLKEDDDHAKNMADLDLDDELSMVAHPDLIPQSTRRDDAMLDEYKRQIEDLQKTVEKLTRERNKYFEKASIQRLALTTLQKVFHPEYLKLIISTAESDFQKRYAKIGNTYTRTK